MNSQRTDMETVIEEITPENLKDVNTCDGEFIIDSRLALYVENDEIHYKIVKISKTRKRYQEDEIDINAYLHDSDKAIFLAKVNGQTAGQIILRGNWNNFAYIEDIAVDIHFRRKGIGKKLIAKAARWARGIGLAGIMLETQNNNVAACKFYEKCGFRLGGFDRFLYKGINRETEEAALYWYLFFEPVTPDPPLN